MSGKIKLTVDEILNSNRKIIDADIYDIYDEKFKNYNKRKTVIIYTCVKCNKKVWTSFEKALKKFNHICIGCNTKSTLNTKYGVESISQLPKNRENLRKLMKEKNEKGIMKQGVINKFGVDNVFKLPNVRAKNKMVLSSDEHKEKMKLFYQNHPEIRESMSIQIKAWYADENNKDIIKNKNLHIRNSNLARSDEEKQESINKRNKTMMNLYGTTNPAKLQSSIKTCLRKYNSPTYFGSEQHKEIMKNDRIEHPEKYNQHGKQKYKYNDLNFDSKCEMDFYIFCKINNIPCERNSTEFFTFTVNDKDYRYFPDFKIGDCFMEIKGNQFVKEDGTWQNIYNHDEDYIYEAKHQCALLHNVKIVYYDNLDKFKSQLLSSNPHNSLNLGSE